MVSICKRTGTCYICGNPAKCGIFDKFYCEECYEKRPKHGKGSGGLIALPQEKLDKELSKEYPYEDIYFQMVPKGNKIFASLYLSHYPASKGIVGRSINYIIYYKKKIVGIIGLTNPPYAIAAIDEFFGINKNNRNVKNLEIANNHVFRLIYNEPNLATRCLRILRKVAAKDWKTKYGNELKGLMTFVEPPRDGTCYKADNWSYLDMTKGFGTTQRSKRWETRKWVHKEKKHIYAFKI